MEEMTDTETREIPVSADQHDRVRHGRARAVMVVVTGLIILAAFVLGAVGYQARSGASDERASERAATQSRRTLEHQQRVADRARTDTMDALRALHEKFDALGAALASNEAAQDHFTDVVNRGADLHNGGDVDGAKTLYQGEATAALTDVAQRNADVQQAWKDVQAALGALEEAQ